jgi:hypothetical protein
MPSIIFHGFISAWLQWLGLTLAVGFCFVVPHLTDSVAFCSHSEIASSRFSGVFVLRRVFSANE